MIKTMAASYFALYSLQDIRTSMNVILQAEKTGAKFDGNGQDVYLCEIVTHSEFHNRTSIERVTAELLAANEENRKLHRKIGRLEAELRKTRKRLEDEKGS